MIKRIQILFYFTLICSYAAGLSIYGIGENVSRNDPASVSMGNSIFFAGNSKNISQGSSSSIWRSALTRFYINSNFNIINNVNIPSQYYQNISTFSFHFPVGNKKVFGFGLQPLYRINRISINDKDFQYIGADISNTGKPIAFRNNYFIDGGVSEAFIQYSQKYNKSFSAGFKYSILFGNQIIKDELYTYDIKLDSVKSGYIIEQYIEGNDTIYISAINENLISINKYQKFSGYLFTMEGRYNYYNHEFVIMASTIGRMKVSAQNNQISNNLSYKNYFDNSIKTTFSELGIGYLFKLKNNIGFSLELNNRYPIKIPTSIALFDILPPATHSIHFGNYYGIQNPKIGFWNNINLRQGMYLKELDFSGQKLLDYGITLGLGIEYLSNSQSIDFAIKIGKKESKILNGINENYISFYLAFSSGEKWFMKRRRK
tara:strand:+ start:1309 stop:2598 length:1290 start_codon:yes stop_codon:yes gene_type:complete